MEGLEELTLELCDRCPQRCLHCSSNSSPTCSHEVDLTHSLRLIREAAALGTRKLSLGGGEPLLSDHLQQVLDAAVQSGMHVEVFTSGLASLPPHATPIADHVLRSWNELPHFKVIFSLQGATESVHDYVTQTEGSYRVLLASLERCLASGIACEVNFVPLRPNVAEFSRVVDIASSLGLRKVSVLRFVPQGRGAQNQRRIELSWDEENMFVQQLVRLRESQSIAIRTGSPFNGIVPGNRVPCRAGAQKLVVQADGNVLPCEVFKDQRRRAWRLNIYEQSLADILRSPKLIRLRKALQESDCLECPIHCSLRKQLRMEGEHERISEPAIHAQ